MVDHRQLDRHPAWCEVGAVHQRHPGVGVVSPKSPMKPAQTGDSKPKGEPQMPGDQQTQHDKRALKHEETLVDRQELEAFIDRREELKPYSDFIKRRWLKMVIWWHNRSVEARRKYFFRSEAQ